MSNPHVAITIRLKPETHALVQKRAEEEGRSLNNLITRIIDFEMQAWQLEQEQQ